MKKRTKRTIRAVISVGVAVVLITLPLAAQAGVEWTRAR